MYDSLKIPTVFPTFLEDILDYTGNLRYVKGNIFIGIVKEFRGFRKYDK